MSDDTDRFNFLRDSANKFCEAVGLRKDLFLEIYKVGNDWAFIIQTDALLETASKDLITRFLKMEVNGKVVGAEGLEKFVQTLPMNGRTSLQKLLRISGCEIELCDFIESVRIVRNSYAHDIRMLDANLLDVIMGHAEGSRHLRRLAPIKEYDEKKWIKMIGQDDGVLRYGIFFETLRFLTLGYHVAVKDFPAQVEL